jgi:plasmid stabilization system protein ParE
MKVVWSSRAEEAIGKIKLYLIDNWSEKVADNFIKEVGEKIEILKRFPDIGRVSSIDGSVKKILIVKHLLLYYRVKKNKLEILDFFDQHQDPDKANY